MDLTERRRYPRWHSDRAHISLFVPGEKVERCRVRCVSRVGLFIETRSILPEGLTVELAFTRSYTRQLVKLYRRSAYVVRASEDGVAVVFLDKRANST